MTEGAIRGFRGDLKTNTWWEGMPLPRQESLRYEERWFQLGKNIRRTMDHAVEDREGRADTMKFFWVKEKVEGKNTIFIDIPVVLGSDTSPDLVMIHTDEEFRKRVGGIMKDGSREEVQGVVREIIDIVGLGEDPLSVRIDNIAFIEEDSNAQLSAITNRDKQKKVLEYWKQNQSIEVRKLPRKVKNAAPIDSKALDIAEDTPRRNEVSYKVEKVETEDEQALQTLDEQVELRHITGKFQEGKVITIHGNIVYAGESLTNPDYITFPKEVNKFQSSQARFFIGGKGKFDMLKEHIDINSDNHSKLLPGNFRAWDTLCMAYSDVDHSIEMVDVAMYMPASGSDSENRGLFNALAGFRISKAGFDKLKKLIKKNPANAERWLQICFEGIDETAQRLPVDKLMLIDVDNYFPKRKLGQGDQHSPEEYNEQAVDTLHFPNSKKLPNARVAGVDTKKNETKKNTKKASGKERMTSTILREGNENQEGWDKGTIKRLIDAASSLLSGKNVLFVKTPPPELAKITDPSVGSLVMQIVIMEGVGENKDSSVVLHANRLEKDGPDKHVNMFALTWLNEMQDETGTWQFHVDDRGAEVISIKKGGLSTGYVHSWKKKPADVFPAGREQLDVSNNDLLMIADVLERGQIDLQAMKTSERHFLTSRDGVVVGHSLSDIGFA